MLLGEYAAICQRLSDEYSESVVNVWPARQHIKAEDRLSDDVTLVVMTKEADFSMSEYEHHKVHVCCIHNTVPESQANMTQDVFLSREEDDSIGRIISEKARSLCRKHSNITMIKPSAVKITGGKPIAQLCICICCKVKGMVPLGEELFPEKIDGIEVDVIVGSVVPCMGRGRTPIYTDVRQQSLKVSSSISHKDDKPSYGTIGGFCSERNDKQRKVGLITAYHSLTCNEKLPICNDKVVQPGTFFDKKNRNDNECGAFKYGCVGNITFDQEKYYADVAFCEIKTDRAPTNGLFPEQMPRNGLPNNISLNEVTVKEIDENSVYKVGQSTFSTTGTISTAHVYLPKFEYDGYLGTRRDLQNVIEITPKQRSNHDNDFALEGDSGSLVFDIRDKKPNILGMIFGVGVDASIHKGYACHIRPVLNAMDLEFNTFVSMSLECQ